MSGGERSDLDDLYGEMILDHNRHPRNFGRLVGANHMAVGHNPLCGDRVAVYLRLADDTIADIAFDGVGCAISTASASMMTEALRGRSLVEAEQLFQRFHRLLTAASPEPADGAEDETELGKLMALEGVKQFPMRVKCATLAWHALQSALASPELHGEAGAGAIAPAETL
jgi:nitrogen fixation NifU-like protein